MELPKHISSLSGNSAKLETSRFRFYSSLVYLILGLIYAFFLPYNLFMGYFFIFGIAGLISYHLYSRNPKIGVTFDTDSIRIQPTLFKKKTIPMNEIVSVDIHLSSILLNLKNNHSEKIEVSNYTFGAVKELKESFKEYALLNKIECVTK